MWFLPWGTLGHRGTLTFFFLSLLSLFVGVVFEPADLHPLMVPSLLVTLFAWNGFAHDRWMPLKLAPLALRGHFMGCRTADDCRSMEFFAPPIVSSVSLKSSAISTAWR